MAITVAVELDYEFAVKAPFKDVFELLADVPASASFYPQVERLVDLGEGSYRWEMARIGVASVHLQTIYASHYVANRAKGSITWTPLSDQGNALVGGSWKIGEQKKKTTLLLSVRGTVTLLLSVRGTVTLPLPALMKSVLAPLVTAEFERLTESYLANLIAHWGGEA